MPGETVLGETVPALRHRRSIRSIAVSLLTVGMVAVGLAGCAPGSPLGGPDPADYFDAGTVRVLQAARDGDVERIRQLIREGQDPNTPANDHDARRSGITPLQWAVEFGRPRTVETLLRGGADPLVGSGGYNAASYALLRDKTDSLRALIDVDPSLADAPGRGGGVILHVAVLHYRADAVEMLIDADADLDAEDPGGRTPIFTAASVQNVAACLVLIRAGADGGHRDHRGDTFLSSLYLAKDSVRTREFLGDRDDLEDELRSRGFPVETGR
ncbi:ankyrin repeat domain-containing protein [Gordonia soli]|uniref:Uncharacterized protein n=1 Tax=Gordonia soli NBRC 108243 TaxID=1223545 RepID=M0QRX0_9ACTN|nr:ankyrin repeat domain-containing protein [Gordonia soli]GAC70467.1 hypothetical protein GS4_35_00430 [Gordonia soli NBRC 108243]